VGERLLFDDYELRGFKVEIWAENSHNWWICTKSQEDAEKLGVRHGFTLTDTDFKPKLTDQEVNEILDAVYDWYAR
jgi:hypothetical protein